MRTWLVELTPVPFSKASFFSTLLYPQRRKRWKRRKSFIDTSVFHTPLNRKGKSMPSPVLRFAAGLIFVLCQSSWGLPSPDRSYQEFDCGARSGRFRHLRF